MSEFKTDHEGIDLRYYKNDFEGWNKQKEISYNNNEIRQREKYRFMQFAYDYISGNYLEGDYYEFGCHKARTFRMSLSEAAKKMYDKMHFYAFDSFEGLPEAVEIDKFPGWEQGQLATSEEDFWSIIKNHGLALDRIRAIKGYYNQSLTPALQKEFLDSGRRVAICYVDCDFYDSTLSVLDFIDPLLQEGSIVCFDDWNCYKGSPLKGEKRAFREYCQRTSWKFDPFVHVGWCGMSFTAYREE